jgi:hypothetical protein
VSDTDLITCDACPVLCRIRDGRAGACDRYANVAGALTRVDPLLLVQALSDGDGKLVPFLDGEREWDGALVPGGGAFVTAHRRQHDLSRLQAGTVHRRQYGNRWRRHGDGRHRGHLQLLRAEGEDRHRPASSVPRTSGGALWRRGRSGMSRPAEYGSADAQHWAASASSDRGQQARRQGNVRNHAAAVQQTRLPN